MQKRKIPIGIQTFSEIRDPDKNYIYIDKTDIAYKLIDAGKYFFLSRPRRFGKSLFVDTLSEIFKGNKQYFKGLFIEDEWDWKQNHPVIKINLASGDFSSEKGINNVLQSILTINCEDLQINKDTCIDSDLGIYFKQLIRNTYNNYKQKVVILIDEYDKPILDNIAKEDKSIALKAREILRNFYSSIKASDQYLRFVFITGVSKFSKLNLFSGLNNIQDITNDKKYATITGYTQADLEREFADHLEGIDLKQVQRWYNGYNWFGAPVYNPFDILLFIANDGKYGNYWWQTGNPSFLIDILKKSDYYLPDLQNVTVSEEALNAFDVEHIDLTALLWQTGYLTFDKEVGDKMDSFYKLKVPNIEVQKSLNTLFFDYLTNMKHQKNRFFIDIKAHLKNRNIKGFEDSLRSLFASIPYSNYVNNTISNFEGYYASVIYTFLASLGFDVIAEDYTNRGRIDMTMKYKNLVYILEFKVDQEQEKAIHQIQQKKYYEKYKSTKNEIHLIGIHFSSKDKNISSFEHKKL